MSNQRGQGNNGGGISIGAIVCSALAAWASYTLGNPIGWVAIYAIFGWFYLLYLCAGCGGGLPGGMF